MPCSNPVLSSLNVTKALFRFENAISRSEIKWFAFVDPESFL